MSTASQLGTTQTALSAASRKKGRKPVLRIGGSVFVNAGPRPTMGEFPEVAIHECALSDTCGEGGFFVNLTRQGWSGLGRHAMPGDRFDNITVQVRSLDEVVGDRRVDFIKIDVEGYELKVLQGALQVLRGCRPALLFESTMSALSVASITAGQVHAFLSSEGYSICLPSDWLLGRPPLSAEAFEEAHRFPFRGFDFIGVPTAARPGHAQRTGSPRHEVSRA